MINRLLTHAKLVWARTIHSSQLTIHNSQDMGQHFRLINAVQKKAASRRITDAPVH